MLVATSDFWKWPRRTRRQTRSSSLGGRSSAERSTTARRDPARELADTFRGIRSRADWCECLRHHRSRLSSRRRRCDQLGERPVYDCRSCLGARNIAPALPNRGRRYLRRVFVTGLCALETAVRRRMGPPETNAVERGENSANQFRDPRKTLAVHYLVNP